MEWLNLLAFVFLSILLGSLLYSQYNTRPMLRNIPDNREVNYNFVYKAADADADAEDPYDLNAGWKGFYRDHLHAFDSSGNYL